LPDEEEQPIDAEEAGGSLRPFWSGTITFGLVSIPVSLFPANRSNRVSLRILGPDGTPLQRRYFSSETGKQLSAEDMVRGYEIEKDRFVVVTDEELERLAPEKSRDIDLRRFVEAQTIPPLYFERAYFLVPAGPSAKAYRLLAATMEKTGRAGIATFVMRGKEYLVAILSENDILRAETMRFYDEVRSPKDVGLPESKKTQAAQAERLKKAIKKLERDEIATAELTDEDAEKLLKLAKQKRARKQDVVESEAPAKKAEVIDIMSVLRRSLTMAKKESAGGAAPKRAKAGAKKTRSPRTRSA
jgi:DNA end-binding protein Ku